MTAGGRDGKGSFDRSKLFLLLLLLLALGYSAIALRYPLGELSRPGPGLVPLLAGGAASVLLAFAVFGRGQEPGGLPLDEDEALVEPTEGTSWPRTLAFIGVLIGYVVVLENVGQLAASVVMLLATLLICRSRPLWQMVLVSVGISLVSFWVFDDLLNVPLPTRVGF